MNNPQIPEAFISVIGLGAPRGYFPVKSWNRWGSLVIFFILLAGAVLVFLFGIYDTYVAYQQHGPAMIDDKLTGPLVIAFVLFAFGLLAGWGAYANWNKGVAAYERGFAYNDRKGIQIWHWEDVGLMTSAITRHYTNGIYTGTTHIYTLYNRQNQRLVLADSFGKVEELAKNIDQSIFPLLYRRAADQYNAGQAIVFGPVAISKVGIAIGKKTYPWTDVKEVSIHKGILKVSRKDGGWFSGASAAASTIPNLRVFLSIIDQVTGVKAG
ncbi:MAG: hypothetical protein IMZ50_17595 [Candidatus Atribacteria bacterium]|nr:hypothetical protein [Candidatus Atribacteria bacterium]